MTELTLAERNFLVASLKKNYLFYKKDINDQHHNLIKRGYCRIAKCYVGPLHDEDPDVLALPLTEAGRFVAEQLIYPS